MTNYLRRRCGAAAQKGTIIHVSACTTHGPTRTTPTRISGGYGDRTVDEMARLDECVYLTDAETSDAGAAKDEVTIPTAGNH
jgi:hypothetical protein